MNECFEHPRERTEETQTWLERGTVAPEGQLQLLGLSPAITTARRFCNVLHSFVTPWCSNQKRISLRVNVEKDFGCSQAPLGSLESILKTETVVCDMKR